MRPERAHKLSRANSEGTVPAVVTEGLGLAHSSIYSPCMHVLVHPLVRMLGTTTACWWREPVLSLSSFGLR